MSRSRTRKAPRVRAPERRITESAPPEFDRSLAELRVEATRSKAAFFQLCRHDVNVFSEYVLMDERGRLTRQAPIHVQMHAALDAHGFVVVMAHPECGKAVPLDTPIPVPGGFLSMGELHVGDDVFDRRGRRCRVTWAGPTQLDRVVCEVEFDDGGSVLADADHRWVAWTTSDLRAGREPRVVTTAEMAERLRDSDRWRWKVPVAGPAEHPEADLPIHPYVLGVWLGDGNSSGPRITYAGKDREIVDRCAWLEGRAGPPIRQKGDVWARTIGGDEWSKRDPKRLKERLRRQGLLGNKHVPRLYMTASVDQRRELLAGILDTDGSISNGPSGGGSRVDISQKSARIASDVLELARSLGFKAHIGEGVAKLYGRVIGPKWRVTFTAREPVFWLRRKRERQILDGDRRRTGHRSVVAIRRVSSVPVRCIAVDSPDSTYLMGRSYTVTHNSSQIGVVRTLWKIGNDPARRVLLLNEAQQGGSEKTLGAIKRYIEGKVLDDRGVSRLHEVFPDLRPGDKWTDSKIRIKGAPPSARDYTVQAVGYRGQILGSRLSDVVLDDLLTHKTTRTEVQRVAMDAWLDNTVFTRLEDDAEVAFLTNAWHKRDAAHTRGWPTLCFPVIDAHGNATHPRWPLDRIARHKAKTKMSAREFARIFLCKPSDDESQVFTGAAIKRCLQEGDGRSLIHSLDVVPPGCLVITGVDLAATKKRDGAKNCLATILVHPNDDRQILSIESGRWPALEILKRCIDVGKRFGGILMVENNGVQQWMVDLLRENRRLLPPDEAGLVPVFPYTTGARKADPTFGVESLAGEMEAGGWIFPSSGGLAPKPIAELCADLDSYAPTDHTPDAIMALWFAVEGARRIRKRHGRRGRGRLDDGDVGMSVIG